MRRLNLNRESFKITFKAPRQKLLTLLYFLQKNKTIAFVSLLHILILNTLQNISWPGQAPRADSPTRTSVLDIVLVRLLQDVLDPRKAAREATKPSRSLLYEAEQRSLMRSLMRSSMRSNNDSLRGASNFSSVQWCILFCQFVVAKCVIECAAWPNKVSRYNNERFFAKLRKPNRLEVLLELTIVNGQVRRGARYFVSRASD